MASVSHLGGIEVLDHLGRPVWFRDLWSERVTLLGFVRHFGCLFCHQQVAEMLDARAEIERRGACLRVIGNGNPVHAREFMTRMGMTGEVYTDPARLLYDQVGMLHGVRRTLNLKSSRLGREARRIGYRQLGVRGDAWQQGGCLLIAPDGELLYEYRSEVAGDHPPMGVILDSIANRPD
jgi:hypothetical protein